MADDADAFARADDLLADDLGNGTNGDRIALE